MRVALISDLHGNEIALRAVLASARAHGVDRVLCLGDIATLGPRPREVIALLRDVGCPCILGNHDQFLLEPETIRAYTELPVLVDAIAWCRAQLDDDDLAYVRTCVPELELGLDDQATLLAFHGSPRSNTEDLLATMSAADLDDALAGRRATVMTGGHTHIQMLRQHRGVLLVNPGSVGLPFREVPFVGAPTLLDHAEYAIVSAAGGAVSVALHRVPVDRAAMHAAIAATDNPFRAMLMAQYAG